MSWVHAGGSAHTGDFDQSHDRGDEAMTQPFADALTWVPKSRALGATLGRAHDLARAKGHAVVTLEHVLLALIEDPDASAVLLASGVDLLELNKTAAAFMVGQPGGTADMPGVAPALTAILEYAVAAARQSKRSEINGAIVLAAVVGEGKSVAARMLLEGGLTFANAVQALKRAGTTKATQPENAGGDAPPPMPEAAPLAGAVEPAVPTAPVPAPKASVSVPHGHDEDPITTARRRIEAARSGRAPTEHGRAGSAAPGVVAEASLPALDGTDISASWAPPPLINGTPTASPRPMRMPPPVPPLAEPRVRGGEPAKADAPNAPAPWSDGEVIETAVIPSRPAPPSVDLGEPIDLERLAEFIPERMLAKAGTTIEVRVPRSAVLATAVAIGGMTAAREGSTLTRALAVRLRAPAGGYYIENSSSETQWLDARSSQHEAEELRWRWLVTPHGRGRKPLQLSMSMRTVAADGIIVDTALPDTQVSVRVADNLRASARTWLVMAAAFAGGAVIALLASGVLLDIVRRIVG